MSQVGAHADPSAWAVEAGESLSSKSTWSILMNSRQAGATQCDCISKQTKQNKIQNVEVGVRHLSF